MEHLGLQIGDWVKKLGQKGAMEHKVGEYILKFKIQTPSVGKTATIVFLFIVKKKKKKHLSVVDPSFHFLFQFKY